MTDRWCILTTRRGADVVDPTDADLRNALAEVWSTTDHEHPNTWLRIGLSDAGPMYVLDVYPGGTVEFSQWADADFDEALAAPATLRLSSLDAVLDLWRSLRAGDLEAVSRAAWQPAPHDTGR